MLRPRFARSLYRDLDVFREHVDHLIARLPGGGRSVDLQPLFFRFTLDTTSAFLFGESTSVLKTGSRAGEMLARSFDVAQGYVVKRFRLLDFYWLVRGREFRVACDLGHMFVDGIISQRIARRATAPEKHEKYLFLDAVADKSRDKHALRGQLLNVLLAGRDTTACLLS